MLQRHGVAFSVGGYAEMDGDGAFVDYYEVLKVNPDCDGRILELAYHYLAKMYHPDNLATADSDRFGEVIEAYRALKDPEQRAEYDREYSRHNKKPAYVPPVDSDLAMDDKTASNDADAHTRILLALYKQRRENAFDPGVIGWFLQEMLGCTDDEFQFHIWYLKSKGFVEVTEQGTVAATVAGVDEVISIARSKPAEPLRIEQGGQPES